MIGTTIPLMLSAVLLVAMSNTSIAETKVGVTSAVRNEVEGITRTEKRLLAAGSQVFLNELVQTGDDAIAHVVFLDNTNLSIGPKSLVHLDTFLFNPDRNLRSVVLEVGRGAIRFATPPTGPKNYNIKTSVATLGIRGTAFELVMSEDGLKIKLEHGAIRVETIAGLIVWLRGAQTMLTVSPNGQVQGPMPALGPITQFASLVADQFGDVTGAIGAAGGFSGGQANPIQFGLTLQRSSFGATRPVSP